MKGKTWRHLQVKEEGREFRVYTYKYRDLWVVHIKVEVGQKRLMYITAPTSIEAAHLAEIVAHTQERESVYE